MTAKSKSYTPMPQVPAELQLRFQFVVEVLSGQITVSEAARRLGVARNHFQSIIHKALEGMIGGLALKKAGRPAVAPEMRELQRDNERLRRENEKLLHRVNNFDRVLMLTAEAFNLRLNAARASHAKPSAPAGSAEDKDDDLPRAQLQIDDALRDCGVPAKLRAAVAGVSQSTMRRRRQRLQQGLAPRKRPGPNSHGSPSLQAIAEAEAVVRDLHGLIGAESLSHQVPELSRRQAAAIKQSVVLQMERERVQRAARVEITEPGVVRGMDAMHVNTVEGWSWILIFADAAVPFRTSILLLDRYDEHAVAAAMRQDFDDNGAPLVLRCDRWKAHRCAAVLDVARQHGALLLSGPPHHPRFYGQLERQNREHRGWLEALGPVRSAELQGQTDVMTSALNSRWPRRTLGWTTSEEKWNQRPALREDRVAFAQEVEQVAASIEGKDVAPIDAQRFAIEHVLKQRGYLRVESGGWC